MNIAAKRLQSLHIAGPKFDTPEEVVRWMGAVQAQDYGQAVWAVALRLKKPSLAAVEKAIADHKIVLTWPMRGTIHFVPAEDAKWMVETLAYQKAMKINSHRRLLGLDEVVLSKVRDVVVAALQGGNRLSRPQLMELFEGSGLSTQQQRGYVYLSYLAETGVICQGPLEGKQQTFVLLDEWTESIRMTRDEAIAELIRRYFTSHGPATIQDFANWTGLGLIEARKGLEAAKDALFAEQHDEKEYWMSKDIAAHLRQPTGLYLLPGFDEFILGYKDRTAVLDPEHMRYVVPGNNGVFRPMIILDGRVVGTWARTVKKTAVEVSFLVFPEFTVAVDALEEVAKSYAGFLGLSLKIV